MIRGEFSRSNEPIGARHHEHDRPRMGAGVVVFGAPLVIADKNSVAIGDDDLLSVLTPAIARVHEQRVVYPRSD